MQLRNHPLMFYRGRPNWPPLWTTTRKDKEDKPRGELGILTNALMHELFDYKCFLIIEHLGSRYMGALTFDDPAFCKQFFTLARGMIGRTIEDLGNVDLSHTL